MRFCLLSSGVVLGRLGSQLTFAGGHLGQTASATSIFCTKKQAVTSQAKKQSVLRARRGHVGRNAASEHVEGSSLLSHVVVLTQTMRFVNVLGAFRLYV